MADLNSIGHSAPKGLFLEEWRWVLYSSGWTLGSPLLAPAAAGNGHMVGVPVCPPVSSSVLLPVIHRQPAALRVDKCRSAAVQWPVRGCCPGLVVGSSWRSAGPLRKQDLLDSSRWRSDILVGFPDTAVWRGVAAPKSWPNMGCSGQDGQAVFEAFSTAIRGVRFCWWDALGRRWALCRELLYRVFAGL